MNNHSFIEAALKSPFYKKKLKGNDLTDWNSIPFTTKDDLRNAGAYDLLGVPIDQIATYHETSGTTGVPTPSWYSHQDMKQEAAVILNSMINLQKDDVVLNRFPFALAVPSFIVYSACQVAGAAHIGADKASFVTPHKRIVEIIERTNPTILTMLPSEAEKIHQAAVQMGISFPKKGLRALLLGGELVSPNRKKYLEKLWGVPVYLFFGSTETGGITVTCDHGHFHLDHPHIKIEVVDDKGNPLSNGKLGNCVLSSSREGMPLLRYFNQDLMELKSGDLCPCGNPNPVIVHHGRKDSTIAWGNEERTFYEIQEAVYSLSSIPFMWKVRASREKIVFAFQYVLADPPSINVMKKELILKLGIPVELEYKEIIPLPSLTEIPAYSKYVHIEREITL